MLFICFSGRVAASARPSQLLRQVHVHEHHQSKAAGPYSKYCTTCRDASAASSQKPYERDGPSHLHISTETLTSKRDRIMCLRTAAHGGRLAAFLAAKQH